MRKPLLFVAIGFLTAFYACNSLKSGNTNHQNMVVISGEQKQWHKVILDLKGPFAKETDKTPNPFMDYKMTVTFTHESGTPSYKVPAYFAADGNAGNTSANEGNIWRAVLSPDKVGKWNYSISFLSGGNVAVDECDKPKKVAPFDGVSGSFSVSETDKRGIDLRGKGRLTYVGGHFLQFSGTKEYFLKAGADAPETLLGYQDFDNTIGLKPKVPLKSWAPHLQDWKNGDPTWKNGKGKGLIGAINYLSSKGMNSFSFLTYNAGGDGDNVWPYITRDDKFHFDCSKLDQWQIVFDHAQKIGMHLHFKLQENENDDNRSGSKRTPKIIKESLDGGATGSERKLYLKELIARFGYELALNWNLGEENTQSTEEQIAMAKFIEHTDPYHHNIVIHTFPNQQDRVYTALLGSQSALTGASLQNEFDEVHHLTKKWVDASEKAGKPWVVANDEQGSAGNGVPQDIGYKGTDGIAKEKDFSYDLNDIRKKTLWGNLMAGGAGVEYYFGYKLPENDLIAEDYRSRNNSWEFANIALKFFKDYQIPFWNMKNPDDLIGNPKNDNSKYCFAKSGEIYLVYLPNGGNTDIDLSKENGVFTIEWFNPRVGGKLSTALIKNVNGGAKANLGNSPNDLEKDWLIVLKKK